MSDKTRQALSALLAKLVAATGPNREVDTQIWLAVSPGATRKQSSYIHVASGKECHLDETRDATHRLIIVPRYTESLDAAMTLVPDDLPYLRLEHYSDGWYARMASSSVSSGFNASQTKTAALALCIAAVRARLAGQKEHP